MIQEIKCLSHCFQVESFPNRERSAKSRIHVEQVESNTGVSPDHAGYVVGTCGGIPGQPYARPTGCGLNIGRSRDDVERKRRVILQRAT